MQERGRWLTEQLIDRSVGPTLDVGCGRGRHLQPGHVGIDLDPTAVRDARGRSRLVAVADAHHLPFRDFTFKTTYAIRMLNAAAPVDEVLVEIRRVLTSDGRLLVYTRARPTAGDRLDPDNGARRLGAHFRTVQAHRDPEEPGGVLFVAER